MKQAPNGIKKSKQELLLCKMKNTRSALFQDVQKTAKLLLVCKLKTTNHKTQIEIAVQITESR